jgi:hypothetical protein
MTIHTTRKFLLNLAAGAAAALALDMPAPAMAQLSFGLQVGPDGKPKVSIGVGTPSTGEVCFFTRTSYRGDSFCVDENTTIRDLEDWDGEISSFRNPDGLAVTLCTRTRLRGTCRTYDGNVRSLGGMDDEAASLQVR